jgi:hypothetical protein
MKARMLERENAAKLAQLVYELLRFQVRGADSIELVRPPNPGHGHAIAVLFADGRDVVIRFEEAGGK